MQLSAGFYCFIAPSYLRHSPWNPGFRWPLATERRLAHSNPPIGTRCASSEDFFTTAHEERTLLSKGLASPAMENAMQEIARQLQNDEVHPPACDLGDLRSLIDRAKHYLPTQGPISVFVHHNTLHSYEQLSFDEAVVKGLERYGCEPYLSEARYLEELEKGRFSMDDLRQALMDDLGEESDVLVACFGTRYTLRLAMLQMRWQLAPEAELKWMLAETELLRRFDRTIPPNRRENMISETRRWVLQELGKAEESSARRADASNLSDFVRRLVRSIRNGEVARWTDADWEGFVLTSLWHICRHGVDSIGRPATRRRAWICLRELLFEVSGQDIGVEVNEVLIRFCGAFLDQGFANWPLPNREQGFARSFALLYLQRAVVLPHWMQGIEVELSRLASDSYDPLSSINESLDLLGIRVQDREEYVCATLLALRGWAGMLWQTECRIPFLPNPIPEGSLDDYLAVRLLLMRYALSWLGNQLYGTRDLRQIRSFAEAEGRERLSAASLDERTYTIFQLAQACSWTPQQLIDLSPEYWECLSREVYTFDSLRRRRILHAAYERHYHTAALDAVAIHAARRRALRKKPEAPPDYAAVFCIDDREESFRRHLEEVDPHCITASAAGFFAVAMFYQGADHAQFRPLCPAIMTPDHYVREEPLFSAMDAGQRRAERRRRLGWLTHRLHLGSRTMLGGWITGVLGAIATIPMVARILAPRLASKVRDSLGTLVRPPATELHIERIAAEPGPESNALGYSLQEMSDIVIRILQDIGMTKQLPPIVVFFGHGSSSLNNPHESAYNCGACSGGRGGPNARAFANMANDPRVRRLVWKRGIELSEEVRFVGAYHNTCSDEVEYYDLDLLPRSHRALFRRIEASVHETRARNAHERTRRFESAPLDLSLAGALEHVEQRAEDLSQARPEYNHATNALVVVGRRDWTRGLFMDRRVFLTEYDPTGDDENATILTRILQAAMPVCAGISLEYYFSTVDVEGYGCGSKLPHNVASMLGVMTGAASDLRPGLSQQMIEIHEPMRILFIVETTSDKMEMIMAANPAIAGLVDGKWVHLSIIDSATSVIHRYVDGQFVQYTPHSSDLPSVSSSAEWYQGKRESLGFASIST